MKNIFTLLLIFFASQVFGNGDGHLIKITTENYSNDTLIAGYYFADRQLVHDTIIGENGLFSIKGDNPLKGGMYLVIFKPANDYIQFMVNDEDQHFNLNVDFKNLQSVKFEGSKDNDIFYEYVDYE